MIIEIADVWNNASAQHRGYLISTLPRRLAKYRKRLEFGPQTRNIYSVRAFIRSRLRAIIEADAEACIALASEFDGILPPSCPEREIIIQFLRTAFNYAAFRDKKSGWSAYTLCDKSIYKVCPYCQINTTETVPASPGKKGYRPHLDHVLCRFKYPFLALTLGNLVPSCGLCNGPNMKFKIDFMNPAHLHPLKDSPVLRFSILPAKGVPWSPELSAMRASNECYVLEIDTGGDSAAEQSESTFQLTSRYQPYVHEARRIARFADNGRAAYGDSLFLTTGIKLKIVDELGFSHVGDEYKSVPLGRMRRDVYLSRLLDT